MRSATQKPLNLDNGSHSVFPDTNALLSLIIFPQDSAGRLTLAGELKELYQEGKFDLILSKVVISEVLDVVKRDFFEYQELVEHFLQPFEETSTRWPSSKEVKEVCPYVVDPDDAPIFAGAVLSNPDIVLSNDFETFHTDKAKKFWKRHDIQLESLYGLLCFFGERERKDT